MTTAWSFRVFALAIFRVVHEHFGPKAGAGCHALIAGRSAAICSWITETPIWEPG